MNEITSILKTGIEALGIRIEDKKIASFERYTVELCDWAEKTNLTGHREKQSIEIYHYLDSLSLFQSGLLKPGLSVLDVGSGAGFPGLPLKIIEPSLEMVLLEASRKRGAFLKHIVRSLGLTGVDVAVNRAETYAENANRNFDRILCRAVAPMEKVCSWTLPLLRDGGLYLFQKSRKVMEEINGTMSGLEGMGLRIRVVSRLSVPYADRERFVVIIEKI